MKKEYYTVDRVTFFRVAADLEWDKHEWNFVTKKPLRLTVKLKPSQFEAFEDFYDEFYNEFYNHKHHPRNEEEVFHFDIREEKK